MDAEKVHSLVVLSQTRYKKHHFLAVPKGSLHKREPSLCLFQELLDLPSSFLPFSGEIALYFLEAFCPVLHMFLFQVQIISFQLSDHPVFFPDLFFPHQPGLCLYFQTVFPVPDKSFDILSLFMIPDIAFQISQRFMKGCKVFFFFGKTCELCMKGSQEQIHHCKTLFKTAFSRHIPFFPVFLIGKPSFQHL